LKINKKQLYVKNEASFSTYTQIDLQHFICYYHNQEGNFFPGPWVREDAPVKCNPRCEAVNREDCKGGNLP